jgi:hypothetical protein
LDYIQYVCSRPVTVVEAPEFVSATQRLMTEAERVALVDYLAHHPAAGDLIPGTGGVRKLRWTVEGRGKRGGARVIYTKAPAFRCSHSRLTPRTSEQI